MSAATAGRAKHLIECSPASAEITHEGAQRIRKIKPIESAVGAWPGARTAQAGVAELVVGAPLLVVLEDLVSLRCFLEFLLRRLVPGVLVGVVLYRQPAIRLLDLVSVGVAIDAEDVIVVAFVHS